MSIYYISFPRSVLISLAIASSSLVGITQTLTLESGVEITAGSPCVFALTSSSIVIPKSVSYTHLDVYKRQSIT